MGLLDSVISAAASTLLKDNSDLQNKLSGMISQFFDQVGGLPGLVQKFQANGLSKLIASWVGQEDNLPITEDQLHQVIGTDLIKNLAEKSGVDAELFDTLLAKGLPKLVNALTPEGQSPEQVTHIDQDKVQELIGKIFS